MHSKLFYLIILSISIGCLPACSAQEVKQNHNSLLEKLSNPKTYDRDESVTCSLLDSKAQLWFGTNTEGLFRYEPTDSIKSFIQFTESDGLCSNYISCMTEDHQGNLWLGTPEGLCRYDGEQFTYFDIPWSKNQNLWGKNMNDHKVICIMEDSKGMIWFGTWGGGAYRFDPNLEIKIDNFTSFLANEGRVQESGLHQNAIQSITEDNQGNLWFCSMTHGGISRFNGETWVHYTMKEGLLEDMIATSLLDSEGNMWFGCLGNRDGGLIKYDGNEFKQFNVDDGMMNNNVWTLSEDQNGNIWIGSNRGPLSYFDGQNFIKFTNEDKSELTSIHVICNDMNQSIWFGGLYGQLWRYDGDKLTDFTQKKSTHRN